MERLSGYVGVNGSVAYAAQQPWIQNKSLRDNITFGTKYNQGRFENVIDGCALRPDLQLLPDRDLTEIGEKVGIPYFL